MRASLVAREAGAAITPKLPKPMESPVKVISQAIEQCADESGWAFRFLDSISLQ